MNAIPSLNTCASDFISCLSSKSRLEMTSTVKEKSVTVTASFNEVSGTPGSSWAQEVSDTAKGSKSWEIACKYSANISVNVVADIN